MTTTEVEMRGVIPDDVSKAILDSLPELDQKVMAAITESDALARADLIHHTSTSVALVCFDDAVERFFQVVRALFEAQACLKWHRDLAPDAPDELEAVTAGKFYVDYALLLLYAAGEDISFFITHFL